MVGGNWAQYELARGVVADGKVVLPIAWSGGAAARVANEISKPNCCSDEDWLALKIATEVTSTAMAICEILRSYKDLRSSHSD